jgi:hypothetical protein
MNYKQFHDVIIEIPNLLKLTHCYWEFDAKDIISISITNDVSKYIEYLHDRWSLKKLKIFVLFVYIKSKVIL